MGIIVSGMVAGDPGQGGATWAVLQYVLGLRNLGHDVCVVEPIAAQSLRPEGAGVEDTFNARYFLDVVERFHLDGRAALLRQDTRETIGASAISRRDGLSWRMTPALPAPCPSARD